MLFFFDYQHAFYLPRNPGCVYSCPTVSSLSRRDFVLTVTITVLDDWTQPSDAALFLQAPNNGARLECLLTSTERSTRENNSKQASFIFQCTLPQYSAQGTWGLFTFSCQDEMGRSLTVPKQAPWPSGSQKPSFNQTALGDAQSPRITGVRFSQSMVNTSEAAINVTLLLNVSDDLSGVSACSVSVATPSGALLVLNSTNALITANSSLRFDVPLPRYALKGSYNLSRVLCVDRTGRTVEATATASDPPGSSVPLAIGFAQVADGDTMPPLISSYVFVPNTPIVDTTMAWQTVLLTITATDTMSGVRNCSAILGPPENAPASALPVVCSRSSNDIVGFVAQLDCVFTLPRFSARGEWALTQVACTDNLFNTVVVIGANLLTRTVHQTGVSDVTAPTIVSVVVDNRTINTTAAAVTFSLRLQVTDDVSGLASCEIELVAPGPLLPGLQSVMNLTATRQTGSATNGWYSLSFSVPRFSPEGMYNITSIVCTNAAGLTSLNGPSALLCAQPRDKLCNVSFTQVGQGDVQAPMILWHGISPREVSASTDSVTLFSVNFTDDFSGLFSCSFLLGQGNFLMTKTLVASSHLVQGTPRAGKLSTWISLDGHGPGVLTLQQVSCTDVALRTTTLSQFMPSEQLTITFVVDTTTVTSTSTSTSTPTTTAALTTSSSMTRTTSASSATTSSAKTLATTPSSFETAPFVSTTAATGVGSTSVGSTSVGSTSVGSTSVGSTSVGSGTGPASTSTAAATIFGGSGSSTTATATVTALTTLPTTATVTTTSASSAGGSSSSSSSSSRPTSASTSLPASSTSSSLASTSNSVSDGGPNIAITLTTPGSSAVGSTAATTPTALTPLSSSSSFASAPSQGPTPGTALPTLQTTSSSVDISEAFSSTHSSTSAAPETTTPPAASPGSSSSRSEMSVVPIIAGAVGGVVLLIALFVAAVLLRRRRVVLDQAAANKRNEMLYGTQSPFVEYNTLCAPPTQGSNAGNQSAHNNVLASATHARSGRDSSTLTDAHGYEIPSTASEYDAVLAPASARGERSGSNPTDAQGYEVPMQNSLYYSQPGPASESHYYSPVNSAASSRAPEPYSHPINSLLYRDQGTRRPAAAKSAAPQYEYASTTDDGPPRPVHPSPADAPHYEYASTSDAPPHVAREASAAVRYEYADRDELSRPPVQRKQELLQEGHYFEPQIARARAQPAGPAQDEPDYMATLPIGAGRRSRTLSFLSADGRPLLLPHNLEAGSPMGSYDLVKDIPTTDYNVAAPGPAGRESTNFDFDGSFADYTAAADAALFHTSQI
jgi:hypothetical protein